MRGFFARLCQARSRRRPASPAGCSSSGSCVTAFFVILAIFAPWLAPYGFDQYKRRRQAVPQAGTAELRSTGSARTTCSSTCCLG